MLRQCRQVHCLPTRRPGELAGSSRLHSLQARAVSFGTGATVSADILSKAARRAGGAWIQKGLRMHQVKTTLRAQPTLNSEYALNS